MVLPPRFLTPAEREQIADLRTGGTSMRAVAAALGRPPSTVSPSWRVTGTRRQRPRLPALRSQRQAAARRARPKTAKLVANAALAGYVQAGLDLR